MAGQTTIQCLPREILTRIAQLIEEPLLDSGADRAALESFILVCKEWRDIGRAAARWLEFTWSVLSMLEEDFTYVLNLFPNVDSFVFRGPDPLPDCIGPILSALADAAPVVSFALKYHADCVLKPEKPFLFPLSFCQWTKLEHISLLCTKGLRTLPAEVSNWSNLRSLDLSSCRELVSLPPAVGAWAGLEKLKLAGCVMLRTLPEEVGAWTELADLDLSHCAIMFPEQARAWQKLRKFTMTSVGPLPFISLPRVAASWTELREVDFSCSSVEDLPDCVCKWTNLRSLNIRKCKSLRELPRGVGAWVLLESLIAAECRSLSSLPEEVGHWRKLRNIDLRYCFSLSLLPDSIGAWAQVKEVNLCDCLSLSKLPQTVESWTIVEHVSLNFCGELRSLPSGIRGWHSLKHFDLTGQHNVEELPPEVGAWQELRTVILGSPSRYTYAAEDCLHLPEAMGQWTKLEKAALRRLESLPEGVGRWGQLKDVKIDDYMGKALPEAVAGWTSLQSFSAENSCFESLPEGLAAWTHLEQLSLQRCSRLKGLPKALVALDRLRFVCLDKQVDPSFLLHASQGWSCRASPYSDKAMYWSKKQGLVDN